LVNNGFGFAFGDAWPGFPQDPTGQDRGVALTTRTLGFLSQPFYPPGIGGTFSQAQYIAELGNFTPAPGNTAPGPLYNLALLNQLPQQASRWGNEVPDPGYQNGLTFFPGSVPLYKNGQLVGALGVSGDGVEQNDLIAFEGGAGFEPPPELRIDNFEFDGVKLPYLKFPETPR
ncbi:MAG: heme-binding protein, partial [Planctomycetota bacterium]|nr:heme-binding protein [Planctomycetota bacterium]